MSDILISDVFLPTIIQAMQCEILLFADADQLRSNCAADQRLCFHFIDSTIHLLPKPEISNL